MGSRLFKDIEVRKKSVVFKTKIFFTKSYLKLIPKSYETRGIYSGKPEKFSPPPL